MKLFDKDTGEGKDLSCVVCGDPADGQVSCLACAKDIPVCSLCADDGCLCDDCCDDEGDE